MKIGILTFHCAHNYGAVIQCYGLQQYLKSLGHQVFVIDYRPQYLDFYKLPKVKWSLLKKPIRLLKNMVIYTISKKRYQGFESFITNCLNLTPYNCIDDYSDFDAVVLGSDQIWNPRITGGCYDEVFFGKRAKCKVISYAASSRSVKLSESQETFLRQSLDFIDFISVREISLKNLLTPLTEKSIELVVDPSLLPNVSTYLQLITPVKRKRPYVLIYEVKRNAGTHRIANEIAKQLDAEVLELVSSASVKFLGNTSIRQYEGPCEFLSYINNACCVVTSSFHGMALSLKLQKDFYSIRQGNDADLRAESLLSKLELLDRFIPLDQSVDFTQINYKDVLTKLDEEICRSQNFLLKALNNE